MVRPANPIVAFPSLTVRRKKIIKIKRRFDTTSLAGLTSEFKGGQGNGMRSAMPLLCVRL
jgi:hypothetical protein